MIVIFLLHISLQLVALLALLQYNYKAIAETLFNHGKQDTVLPRVRRKLYKLVKRFGIGIILFLCYCVLSTLFFFVLLLHILNCALQGSLNITRPTPVLDVKNEKE